MLKVLLVSVPLVVFVRGRTEELLRHRQIHSLNELGYWCGGLGSLKPGVDWLQFLPRQRLYRLFIGISWTNRRGFLMDVHPNPDAVPNLVFPETQDPMTTTGLDSSALHGQDYSNASAFQSAYH